MRSSSVHRSTTALVTLFLASILASPTSIARPRDREHDFRVRESIAKGAEALRKSLRGLLKNGADDYPMGRYALCLTALLETGASTQDRLVKRTLARLEEMPLEKTYSVSCYLFALDAYWQQKLREDTASPPDGAGPEKPVARGSVREKMGVLVEWLLDARQERGGTWGYEEIPGGIDNSNTQFAVLGLGIAIKHGIPVDEKVLVAVTKYFVKTIERDGKRFRLRLTPETAFGPITSPGKTEATVMDTVPAGWPYTSGFPIASMTAAGASNLLVVRAGLQRLGRGGTRIVTSLDRALYASLAWISSRMTEYIEDNGAYYYTLYSLEKVGDLGGIREFNGRDWYYEGCRALLEKQRPDGSWGKQSDAAHVETSFALLFMTRATRPYQEVEAAPKILTGPGRPKEPRADGRVYVDSLDGFISAREFFYYMARHRDRKTINIGEQVVQNYASDRREELIPLLVMVWGRHSDSVAEFSRSSLREITGVRNDERDFYLKWHRDARNVAALFNSDKRGPVQVGRVLRECEGLPLKTRVLDLIEREQLTETCLDLVDELLSTDDAHRRRVHALLQKFVNVQVAAPEGKSRRDWARTHAQWSEWINGQTGRLLFRTARIGRTVAVLNQPDVEEPSVQANLEELMQFGRDAVPAILEAMRRESFSVHLVVALERLSGEYHGLRVDAWELWWKENS